MIKFNDIKDNLQSGDMILCSGNYPVSKIIREVTNSEYSHVGILHETFDEIVVLESVESEGVRCVNFETKYLSCYGSLDRYNGKIDIIRHSKIKELNYNCMIKLIRKANDLVGHMYNNEEIWDIAVRIMMNRHSGHPVDHGKYICSEYVYFCFRAAGIQLYYDDRGFISPKNILEDENVELIYRDVR
jgi:hypothetical protein